MSANHTLLKRTVATVAVVLSLGVTEAGAAVWTTGGGTFTVAQVNSNIANGDSIVVDVDTTINMDSATNTDNLVAITVNSGITLTVNFTSTGDIVLGNTSAASITVTGTMTVTGTGGGNINFSGETNQILTVTGTIGGTATGNTLDVGNNTLRTTTSTSAVNIVSIGGANAALNPQIATTITSLTVVGALNITPANTIVLTITNPTNVGANKVTFTGSGGGGAEAVNGTFDMNNASSEIETAGADVDDILGDVTVTVSADGATLDTNFNTSPVAVNMTTTSGDLTLQVATGKTLTTTIDVNANTLTLAETGTISTVQLDTTAATIQANAAATITTLTHTAAGVINLADTINLTVTNAFNVGAFKLSLAGSGAGAQDTFTATVQLNNASSELEITGADVDNITGTTVTVSADSATLDTNINTAPTAVNMTTTSGDLTLQVAAGKTMTTTIDVNANTLTMAETGTVSTVQLDTAAATINASAAGTITTLTHSAAGVINLGDTINLTVTNAFNLGANKLTLNGSGAGAQDTFTATVQLNNAASELEIGGVDADNITGFTVTATADGGTLDANITTAPAAVNMTTTAGDLTIEVATGKTMTTTVDVNANTLTLSETGTITTVNLDTAAATINATGNATITTLGHTAAGVITLGDTVNLTVTNAFNVGANKLTLNGSGAGAQDTFTATVQLNNAASELEIAGADVDNITGTTVTVSADGATLDANINTALTAVNMTTTSGDLTLQVASGKTMTTTIDVNANTLTMAEAGTVSTVQLDTTAATIQANAAATITTLTHTAAGVINLGNGINLTVTNAFNIGAFKLSLNGSGGGTQDTFTATVQLNNASSELEIAGADADNITGTTVTVSADGATLDANITTAPTAVNMTTTSGDLTLQVAAGKTMTTTIDVNANTLTMAETGTVSTVKLDTAAATIAASAAATITTLTHTAAGVITLGDTVNLTVTNAFNLGANKLTLNGSGGGGQDTFTATVQLNNASAELEIAGADADNIAGTTVTVSTDGATLDTNINTTPTAVNMTTAAGDLTLQVAAGKTMTTTIDVNANTLTMAETGTISSVNLDTAAATIQANAAGTITTLAPTAAAVITLGDTINLTVTNAFNVGANKLTVNGSGAGGQDTFTATVQLNNAASELEIAGADVDNVTGTTVTVSADGATLDTNINTAPTAVNMTAAAGNLTLQVASGKTLTTTIDVNDNTLTISEAGTVSTVQMDTAAGVVDVDESMSITSLTNTQNFVIDVASGKTLTSTVNIAARTLTFTGTGTVSRVDSTTGTITDNGGTTVSDLRATFGSGGTFTWNGTGVGTITTLANALPGAGDKFAKAGTGTVTIASGITTSFANAAGVLFDITAGTLVVGSAGSNDDITFNDDADEITIASGGVLTTYGSFASSVAGANVNLDAATGSTVNLSSTGGAETFTGTANDDFNLLGTVNINGSNGDYTISDAFDYKFGSVNINSTGSLINNQPSGEIKFVANATVALSGSGTFTVNGQATGTLITVDTTSGSGTFTINRGSSSNLTLKNASLTRSTYTDSDSKPGTCAVTLTGVSFSGTVNWLGGCGDPNTGGGSSTTTTDTTTDDTTDTTTDETVADETVDETTDVVVDPIDDVVDEPVDAVEDEPVEDTMEVVSNDADDTGFADLANDQVDVMVGGLDSGTMVELVTDDAGRTTLTVGDGDAPDLVVEVSGAGQGSEIDVALGDDGGQTLTVVDAGGEQTLSVAVSGLGDSPQIDASFDSNGDQTIVMTDADGSSYSLALNDLPTGAELSFNTVGDDSVEFEVFDPAGDEMSVSLGASNVFGTFGLTVTYDADPATSETARVALGFPGLADERSYGGSVTIAATGLTTNSVSTVELTYFDSDLTGVTESSLRLHRFNATTGEYELAGETDQGARAPTGVMGDYGVVTADNQVWSEVNSFGKFAIGIAKTIQAEPTSTGCGNSGLCGTLGFFCLPFCMLGLAGMKRSIRR